MNFAALKEKLRRIRLDQGITLQQVADRARWSSASIPANLENPESTPTLASLQRYAEAIGVGRLDFSFQTRKPIIITIWNFAGGVAKTCLVRDVGYLLAQHGFKVLLVDTDPQANLTHWLGLRERIPLDQTIYPAVIGNEDELMLPEPIPRFGMNIIPSQMNLADVELRLPGVLMGVVRLRDVLSGRSEYDFILIDSPPALGSLSALAGIAGQHLLIPVPTTDSKGLENLETLMNAIKGYRRVRPGLSICLFVPTKFDARTSLDHEHLKLIQAGLRQYAAVSSPVSLRPGPYGKAQAEGKPVPLHAPDSDAANELQVVTTELLSALGVKVDV